MPARGPAVSRLIATVGALLLIGGEPLPAADLHIDAGWLRMLMPSRPAAGYFVLRNDGSEARVLVGASSPDCESLMLHQSLSESGQERMVMVASVTVPPHGAVRFAPGGYHLMCVSPAVAVHPGGKVPVTLHFADGATLDATFSVMGPTGK